MPDNSIKIFNLIKQEILKYKHHKNVSLSTIETLLLDEDCKLCLNEDEGTLLDYAVTVGSLDTCKIIVESGKTTQKILDAGLSEAFLFFSSDKKSLKPKRTDDYYNLCEFLLLSGAKLNDHVIPNVVFQLLDDNFKLGIKILQLVLKYGANVNVVDGEEGCNLLTMAASIPDEDKSLTVTKLLMDYGINPELSGTALLETPLMYMADIASIDLCELMVEYGADMTMESSTGFTVLDRPATEEVYDFFIEQMTLKYPQLEIAKLYKHPSPRKGEVSKAQVNGNELCKKVRLNKLDDISFILKGDIDINYQDDKGNTPLHYAEKTAIGKLLIEHGADPTIKNVRGQSVLYKAVRSISDDFGKEEIPFLKLLLAHKANINGTADRGQTLLHKASLYGRGELINFLLDSGAAIDQCDIFGKTPLMRAVQKEELETIQILLAHGANPHLTCRLGKTALDHAYTAEVREVLTAAMASYGAGAGTGAGASSSDDGSSSGGTKKKTSDGLAMATVSGTSSSFSASGLFAKLTAGSGSSLSTSYTTMPFPKIVGLVYQPIAGDGHCLFNAVALYVGQEQSALRHIVATHIETHLDEYRDIIAAINPGRTPEEYLADLRKGIERGDNLEITVLMQVLDRPIHVIEASGQLRKGLELDRFKGEPIFVYYNGHNHYDAYVLAEGWDKRASEIASALLSATELSHSPKETVAAGGAGASSYSSMLPTTSAKGASLFAPSTAATNSTTTTSTTETSTSSASEVDAESKKKSSKLGGGAVASSSLSALSQVGSKRTVRSEISEFDTTETTSSEAKRKRAT